MAIVIQELPRPWLLLQILLQDHFSRLWQTTSQRQAGYLVPIFTPKHKISGNLTWSEQPVSQNYGMIWVAIFTSRNYVEQRQVLTKLKLHQQLPNHISKNHFHHLYDTASSTNHLHHLYDTASSVAGTWKRWCRYTHMLPIPLLKGKEEIEGGKFYHGQLTRGKQTELALFWLHLT